MNYHHQAGVILCCLGCAIFGITEVPTDGVDFDTGDFTLGATGGSVPAQATTQPYVAPPAQATTEPYVAPPPPTVAANEKNTIPASPTTTASEQHVKVAQPGIVSPTSPAVAPEKDEKDNPAIKPKVVDLLDDYKQEQRTPMSEDDNGVIGELD